MYTTGNGAEAIYACAEEVKRARVKLQPVLSFELYKGARQEELLCYRSVCRAFCMHNGSRLTKQQARVLEDIREELCIPAQRADAEMLGALEDVFVSSVAASGVLKRREDFFDGVADVPLESLQEGVAARDDNNALCVPPAKVQRTENTAGGGGGGGLQRRGLQARNSHNALHKTIDKIGQEVAAAGRKLLYSVSASEQQAYRRTLQAKKEQLKLLLKEAECNNADVSGSSSAVPSELAI